MICSGGRPDGRLVVLLFLLRNEELVIEEIVDESEG